MASNKKKTPANSSNPLVNELRSWIGKLGNQYACETNDDGVLFETDADDILTAAQKHLGSELAVAVPYVVDEFAKWGPDDEDDERFWDHERFVEYLEEKVPLYAEVGDEDYSSDNPAPGSYYHCFLFNTKAEYGKNVLLAFRVHQG